MPKKKTSPSKPSRQNSAAPAGSGAGEHPFPVVGIAASAGGLEALKALISAIPGHSGIAYILVPHLDPSHASLMVELLRPYAKMPVREVQDETKIQPDSVYIIPPNCNLEVRGGVLHLSKQTEPRGRYTPIDPFLRSLAEDQQERAIGIVLSGTGSHGTLGLQAIKAQGGMTMVQDPMEAEYDQMPRSAIAADVADHVLPVGDMPGVLSDYVKHAYKNGVLQAAKAGEPGDHLSKVLALIRARTKYNFMSYRKNMLMRRVHRRMSLNHIEQPASYIDLLRNNADELKQLFQDFLIGVSGFFRDAEAYAELGQRVIPELIQQKADSDTPIRIWIPGCATGEEAYSVAMVFYEAMDKARKHLPFQIFATDINETGLKTARLGTYPENISADVSPERLKRFFTKTDHHYLINKHLREPVMFAAQNVISDTPFSKLDLICCRNLLIYLEPETQQKILALFHFALNEGGYLFLGASETVGRQIDLFEPLSKKWRIFRRIGPPRPERMEFPVGNHQVLPLPAGAKLHTAPRVTKIGVLAQELLIDTYAPACVLINRKFEILYLHGPTHKYLSMPPGVPTHDLLAMTHQGLSTRIRGLCYQIGTAHDHMVHGDVNVKRNSHYVRIRVTVKEIREPKALEGLLLVSFDDLPGKDQDTVVKVMDETEKNTLVEQLESELKTTREDLQSTIEELESSNEEMKSSNEEMMSMNEELQSANEELETSKEELQSLNEELNTVNNQLEEKVDELDKTNNDLTNLINSADIATIFLDTNLKIRRFTPSTAKLLNLIATDIGRPISDFSYNFKDDQLLVDALAVLERLSPMAKQVWTDEGLCYLRRILPYRTVENRIEGVVVTFMDITPEQLAAAESRRLAVLLKDSNDAVIMTDVDGSIQTWNRAAERTYGYSEAEALHMNIKDLSPPDRHDEIQTYLDDAASGGHVEAIDTQRVAKDGRLIDASLTATRVVDNSGNTTAIMVTERNITQQKHLEQELRNLNKDLERRITEQTANAVEKATQLEDREQYLSAILDTAPDAVITMNGAGVIMSCNPAAKTLLGCRDSDVGRTHISRYFPSLADGESGNIVEEYLKRSKPGVVKTLREIAGRCKNGSSLSVEMSISRVDDHDITVAIARDISERIELEREVIESSAREQERIGREIHDGLGQRLTALTMLATSIEKKAAAGNNPEIAKIRELILHLNETTTEAQALARGLAPVPEFKGGLATALKTLVQGINDSGRIKCSLKLSRPANIEEKNLALQLYRIAQEAVNNAVKHAKARNITVELTTRSGLINLKISDDGKGIAPSKLAHGGTGMHIMRYRADIIGATLKILSEKGKGTTVLCTLPPPPPPPPPPPRHRHRHRDKR